ncbi:MAG: hypothetical protein V9F03_16635 [Microthrixaceae bacterium]
MFALHIETFMLQWATGGLAFLWVTGRRREVSIGYGWLLRLTYGLFALAAFSLAYRYERQPVLMISALATTLACAGVGWVSWTSRKAGVLHQRERVARRSARVAKMTGIDREVQVFDESVPEFPPNLDLIAPAFGIIGVIAGGAYAGSPVWLSVARMVVGAAFMGAVSDGMLLGHWYLTQPGLRREPLVELTKWIGWIWPFQVGLLLVPPGMISALNGNIDDGYNGMLSWFWVACAVMTIVLVIVTRLALKERQYSAVMAATGLLYLAILTAFGTDLVARAILAMA